MNNHTIDDLRRKSALVLNDVMINGGVEVSHRDRPEMVLVLKDHYEHLKYRAEQAKTGKNKSSCMSFPDWMAEKNKGK